MQVCDSTCLGPHSTTLSASGAVGVMMVGQGAGGAAGAAGAAGGSSAGAGAGGGLVALVEQAQVALLTSSVLP